MTLIGGRSSKQGTSLCQGKLGADYIDVTSIVEMNVEDMARLGLRNEGRVRLRTPAATWASASPWPATLSGRSCRT